jgi:hypothetical protein
MAVRRGRQCLVESVRDRAPAPPHRAGRPAPARSLRAQTTARAPDPGSSRSRISSKTDGPRRGAQHNVGSDEACPCSLVNRMECARYSDPTEAGPRRLPGAKRMHVRVLRCPPARRSPKAGRSAHESEGEAGSSTRFRHFSELIRDVNVDRPRQRRLRGCDHSIGTHERAHEGRNGVECHAR